MSSCKFSRPESRVHRPGHLIQCITITQVLSCKCSIGTDRSARQRRCRSKSAIKLKTSSKSRKMSTKMTMEGKEQVLHLVPSALNRDSQDPPRRRLTHQSESHSIGRTCRKSHREIESKIKADPPLKASFVVPTCQQMYIEMPCCIEMNQKLTTVLTCHYSAGNRVAKQGNRLGKNHQLRSGKQLLSKSRVSCKNASWEAGFVARVLQLGQSLQNSVQGGKGSKF